MKFTHTRSAFLLARVLEVVVGLVFLLAASLKALDPVAFTEQIGRYGIFPELAGVAAWSMVTAEVVLAVGLIINWLPRIVPIATAALLLFFIAITAYGAAIGLGENCGCFGNIVHRGPWQVILEDILMLAALVFSTVVLWTKEQTGQTWRASTAVLAGALALMTLSVSPALPVDNLVTTLKPGSSFDSWPVEGLSGLDLNRGKRIVFLFSVGDTAISRHAEAMAAAALVSGEATPVGLIVDDQSHLMTLMFEHGITFPAGALEPRFARPLYRQLPRSFLMSDGTVTRTWSGIPGPADVQDALKSLQ